MTIIDADFIEEDYISAVETMISRSAYAHNKKFIEISRISQDQERGLGYDGVLTAIVPFYVQFKRSQFYTPAYSGKLSKDRQKVFGKPLNSGFLAFKLHRDRHTQMYEQHNAMWKLSQYSSAAYVAPLFYKKRDLTALKQREVDLPWEYRQLKVRDRVFRMGYPLKAVRTFKDSIVVIPHREVKDKFRDTDNLDMNSSLILKSLEITTFPKDCIYTETFTYGYCNQCKLEQLQAGLDSMNSRFGTNCTFDCIDLNTEGLPVEVYEFVGKNLHLQHELLSALR